MSGRSFAVRPLTGIAFALLAVACGANDDAASGAFLNPRSDEPTPSPGDPMCPGGPTGYAGDCAAPPAIDPSLGVVAHYGPLNYDDPDEIASFVIAPGAEFVDCTYSVLSNAAPMHYNRYSVYSRPSMHHVILYAQTSPVGAVQHDDCSEKRHGANLLAVVQGGIQGSRYDYPPSGRIAPENEGLATKLDAHQTIAYEMHAVNATDQQLLRENWTVFYAMPESEVKDTVGQMAFNGGLAMKIEPHTKQNVENSCTVSGSTGNIRVLDFFGHMHAHGERFSAWVAKQNADGSYTRNLVYESYDWSVLDLIEFNSTVQNNVITYAGGRPGGASGDLFLNVGDRIDYECEMNNSSSTTLVFSARAFDGEMCNMFGSFTPGTYWSCLGN
jgi:hypothetical protein